MSNEFAIAAVTITLRNILEDVVELSSASAVGNFPPEAAPTSEIVINNLPLDEAYEFDKAKNQVNLFLYHVEHSVAWRNTDVPGRTRNGESAYPPLGLTLYYIITAYGQDNNEVIGHLLLGKAMSLLHDHPVFSRQEIQLAFPASRLHEQIERVRITPQPISLDDISKLWTGFQTQYKLSVAYQVAVLLIESKRPSRTPLPVLTRGANDSGVFVQPFVVPPFPTLESIQYPLNQTGVQLGDELLLKGHHLFGDQVTIRFTYVRTGTSIIRYAIGSPADQEVRYTIPSGEPDTWPAGIYTAQVIVGTAGERKTSNEMGFTLVPTIVPPIQIVPLSPLEPKGYMATIRFTPRIQPAQHAFLLLGSKECKAQDHPLATDVLDFVMRNVESGDYYIRLRIDGADSLLVVNTVTPPVFNPAHKVTIL